jgi:hypothetical protein
MSRVPDRPDGAKCPRRQAGAYSGAGKPGQAENLLDLQAPERYLTAMPASCPVSADFLSDLVAVCPKDDDGHLPPSFLSDLDFAFAEASASAQEGPSTAELASLAKGLEAWRGHYQRLLQQYLKRLPSDDPLFCPVSLFGTDFGRLETAHTRALAWLLDKEEHGFGSHLLEALLRHLLEGRAIRLTQVNKVASEYPIQCGRSSLDAGRIDVLADGRWEESGKEVFWRLVIEAKIDAWEGEDQLSNYDDWIESNTQPAEVVRVFLTPDGREPETGSADWQCLSFLDLAGVFRHASSGLEAQPGYHFLRYYLTGVLRDVCKLPVPISSDRANPYAAVDYLRSALGTLEPEHGDG